jgi:sugar lactone lactonase YvrE
MSAFFLTPWAAAFHPNGTLLAIAEAGGNRIRLLDLRLGQTATLAGSGVRGFADGVATSAAFRGPRGTAFSPNGATVAIADTDNHRIRLIDLASGSTRTLSGAGDSGYADGAASDAQFFAPAALVFSPDGNSIFVADTAAHRIRRIDATTGTVTTVSGSLIGQPGRADGSASSALFSSPGGLAVAPGGAWLAVADTGNHAIRTVALPSGDVTTLAGGSGPCPPAAAANGSCPAVPGTVDGVASAARFWEPATVAFWPGGAGAGAGGYLLVADSRNNRLRRVDLVLGRVTTAAGNGSAGTADGPSAFASFDGPAGLALAPAAATAPAAGVPSVIIVDSKSSRVRYLSVRPAPPVPTTPSPSSYSKILRAAASRPPPPPRVVLTASIVVMVLVVRAHCQPA